MFSISGALKFSLRTSSRFLRKYVTAVEKIDIESKTGFQLAKVSEPYGSIYYKANGHPNFRNHVFNATGTHSNSINEQNQIIKTEFVSVIDFFNIQYTQRQIIRFIPLRIIPYTVPELKKFDYFWLQRWGFIQRLRYENPHEYNLLGSKIVYDCVVNSYQTLRAKEEAEQFLVDMTLIRLYGDQGYVIPKNSATLLDIF